MIFDPILDLFRGQTITIPPLDGAFRANTDLEEAPLFAELERPDNMALWNGQIVASSGKALFSFGKKGKVKKLAEYDDEITALAVSPRGALAVGLENGVLLLDGEKLDMPSSVKCITALDFAPDGTLWLANGSATNPPSAWAKDLMEKNASGSVWKYPVGGTVFLKVGDDLAFPYGLLADDDSVVVSESWRHRLLRMDAKSGKTRNLLLHIPGYPARLTRAADGGAWMSVFAPRNRLVEMVLREKHYRYDMMASVPREFWIAPSLSSGNSFLEPLQCGGMKLMGIHKPWSPSRSHGMVVHLDAAMMPTTSFHSRANGRRHGTCSAVEHEGQLFVAAKGGNCIVTLTVIGDDK